MIRDFILLLALGCVCVSCSDHEVEATAITPAFVLTGKPMHDFGLVLQGRTAAHTFHLVNESAHDVVPSTVKADCGCTTVSLTLVSENSRIPYVLGTPVRPREALEIECELSTTGKKGQINPKVWLGSETNQQAFSLELRAQVVPVLDLAPDTLDLGTMTTNQSRVGQLEVTTELFQEFHIELIEEAALPHYLHVKLSPREDAVGAIHAWILTATLEKPDPQEGGTLIVPVSLRAHFVGDPLLEIEGDVPQSHETRFFIQAQVRRPLYAEPQYLSFGVISLTEQSTAEFEVVNSFRGHDLQLSSEDVRVDWQAGLTVSPETLVEVASVAQGQRFRVSIVLDPPPIGFVGAVRGTIFIATGHRDMPELELPIFGMVRDLDPAGAKDPK